MSDIRAEGRPFGVPLAGVAVPARVGRAVELARQGVSVGEPQANLRTDPPAGLECPDCGCRRFEVVKVEQRRRYVYRRKECCYCGRRVTTSERIVG